MKTLVLFPADFNDIQVVDYCYKDEYETVLGFPEFMPILFDFDALIKGDEIKLYPNVTHRANCIYRGWMLDCIPYEKLYNNLLERNIRLINSPDEYKLCHMFPKVYSFIEKYTPKSIWFEKEQDIDVHEVKANFDKFIIKDYVKSVKGTGFPKFFLNTISDSKLLRYIDEFIKLRSTLYTGGIVFKEYVDLKLYNGYSNEYRVFYFKSHIISVSRNSNQAASCPVVDHSFAKKFKGLKSNFYTIDFAELSNGRWIVIETGDGQVSGLSPDQYIFKFYEELALFCE
ncbi:MAG: ATP-grasp domain-containing protein [Clostridia bacterium]|nr:ATP-grasp domain-containing protein [Clostridia bacterium]